MAEETLPGARRGWKSIEEETDYWIPEADVIGKIPKDLHGTLLRNGPGVNSVYGTQLKHRKCSKQLRMFHTHASFSDRRRRNGLRSVFRRRSRSLSIAIRFDSVASRRIASGRPHLSGPNGNASRARNCRVGVRRLSDFRTRSNVANVRIQKSVEYERFLLGRQGQEIN